MHSAIHVRGRFWYSLYVSKLHGNIYTLTFNLICFLDGEAKLVVRITPKVVIVTKAVIWWCDHNNKTYTDLTITMFLLCVCSAIYWQFYLNYVPYWLTTEMSSRPTANIKDDIRNIQLFYSCSTFGNNYALSITFLFILMD